MSRWKISQILSVIALATLLQTTAIGHAKLVKSTPSANSTLSVSPRVLELWFSVELQPDFNTVTIKDQNSKVVDTGKVRLAEGNKKIELDISSIPPGTYTVEWSILSTDEHKMRGEFPFTVDLPVAVGATGSNRQDMPTHSADIEHKKGNAEDKPGSHSSPSPSTMHEPSSMGSLQLARWLLLLSMVSLFGAFAYRLFVFYPSISNLLDTSEEQKKQVLHINKDQLIKLSSISLILLVLSAATGVVLQTSEVFDKSVGESLQTNLLYQMISKTQYGTVLFSQIIGLLILLAVLYLLRRSGSDDLSLWWIGLLTSGTLLLTPGLTGHAAAASRDYKLAVPFDWLHMIAAGAWVGGLLHMTLSLRSSLQSFTDHQRSYSLNLIIEKFNTLAITSVTVVILTGIYNSWIHIGSISALWSTGYGRALSIKLFVVLVMLTLGGLNKFILHTRLVRSIQETGIDQQKRTA
jgi:copper transport protein